MYICERKNTSEDRKDPDTQDNSSLWQLNFGLNVVGNQPDDDVIVYKQYYTSV